MDEKIEEMKSLPEFEIFFQQYRDDRYQKQFDEWFSLLSEDEKKEVEAVSTKGRIKGLCLNPRKFIDKFKIH